MREIGTSILALLLLLGIASGFPTSAGAAEQDIDFDQGPGWYFISLQVAPDDPAPDMVFPTPAFGYDHIWGYDPIDGWRHYSPDPSTPSILNDLTEIEPLRGYWIFVSDPPSDGRIRVAGSAVALQSLEGAGWHAIGPLLQPGTSAENVDSVFEDLDPIIDSLVPELWSYSRSTGFVEITDYAAACTSTPEECLDPGLAYWALTTGDVMIGSSFTLEPEGLVLSASRPVQRLRITHTGIGSVAARLIASDPSVDVIFFGSTTDFIHGVGIPAPAVAIPDGPSDMIDLDGDGTPEPCPDLCAGASSCMNLCFVEGDPALDVFVGLGAQELISSNAFSSLEVGQELTSLEIDFGGAVAARAAGAEFGLPQVRLAAKPAVVTGEYIGRFEYGDGGRGSIPFRMFLDDCTRSPGGGVETTSCDGDSLTAVINPTFVGQSDNAIDDDRDGEVDEADEAGRLVRNREGPGFPPDTVLLGVQSSTNGQIQLVGSADVLPDLAFATSATCDTGQCSDGSGACSIDSECPKDGGVGSVFGSASRLLQLDGVRSGMEEFAGTFTERYDSLGFSDTDTTVSTGAFTMRRVAAPQCVVRDLGSTETMPLGIDCRFDSDCPSRCVGDPEFAGASCVAGQSMCGVGTCEPITCAFRELGAPSDRALDRGTVNFQVNQIGGTPRSIFVELAGIAGAIELSDGLGSGQIVLDELPCGIFTVRVTASGCTPASMPVDTCGPMPSIDLQCPNPPNIVVAPAPGLSGGSITLVGAANASADPILLAGGTLDLESYSGQAAVAGRDPTVGWTDEISWPPAEGLLLGLLRWFELEEVTQP